MNRHHYRGDENPTRNETFANQSSPRQRGTRKKKRRLRLFASFLTVLLLLAGGAGWYVFASPLQQHERILPTENANAQSMASKFDELSAQNRINLLLIGTDTRPGEDVSASNTDSLIFASLDMENKRIEMLSIPRDTRVNIPGHGKDKINASFAIGGIKLTEQLVANLLGQPIDYYAITKFGGIKQIVDTIGGVTINVDRDMYYDTGDKQDNIINLKKGLQTLNGSQALGYVRFREDALGDIQRTMRQQTFLKALKDKLLSPQTLPKLPVLIPQFFQMVETNLPESDALKLASRANSFSTLPLIHETLPGSFITLDGISYWEVNPDEAKYVTDQFLNDGKVLDNPVQDPSVTENWQPPQNDQTNTQTNTATEKTEANPDHSGSDAVALVNVNVRSGPGTDYSIITSLTEGQHVRLLEVDGSWDKISLSDGTVGYVAGTYLSIK
jgi:LCP family protein required for cell wall assembly